MRRNSKINPKLHKIIARKKYVLDNLDSTTIYKPQNQKECDETIRLILESQNK